MCCVYDVMMNVFYLYEENVQDDLLLIRWLIEQGDKYFYEVDEFGEYFYFYEVLYEMIIEQNVNVCWIVLNVYIVMFYYYWEKVVDDW